MYNKTIIENTINHVRSLTTSEASGHDWWHIYRVWRLAIFICKKEGGDLFIVELAALLHDIADWKFNNGDLNIGPRVADKWLKLQNTPLFIINKVCDIIRDISFKGAKVTEPVLELEGKIVQDADRLDAIGAVGIARAFAFGGARGSRLHDPNTKPIMYESFESYKNTAPTTINHFYEKLFLLKDRMNSESAKKLALERHAYMEEFINQFNKEWGIT